LGRKLGRTVAAKSKRTAVRSSSIAVYDRALRDSWLIAGWRAALRLTGAKWEPVRACTVPLLGGWNSDRRNRASHQTPDPSQQQTAAHRLRRSAESAAQLQSLNITKH
jgi:hypothetical protein